MKIALTSCNHKHSDTNRSVYMCVLYVYLNVFIVIHALIIKQAANNTHTLDFVATESSDFLTFWKYCGQFWFVVRLQYVVCDIVSFTSLFYFI